MYGRGALWLPRARVPPAGSASGAPGPSVSSVQPCVGFVRFWYFILFWSRCKLKFLETGFRLLVAGVQDCGCISCGTCVVPPCWARWFRAPVPAFPTSPGTCAWTPVLSADEGAASPPSDHWPALPFLASLHGVAGGVARQGFALFCVIGGSSVPHCAVRRQPGAFGHALSARGVPVHSWFTEGLQSHTDIELHLKVFWTCRGAQWLLSSGATVLAGSPGLTSHASPGRPHSPFPL